MSDIKRWLRNRNQIRKSQIDLNQTAADIFSQIEKDHGKEILESFQQHLYDTAPSFLRKTSDNPLEFTSKFLKEPKFKSAALDSCHSNFHRSMLQKDVQEFAHKTAQTLQNLTISDLQKAVGPKEWKRITSKHNPDAGITAVDVKPHLEQFPAHPAFRQMISHEDTFKPHKIEDNGISAKMIHEIDDGDGGNVYMAKPYHKNIESATKSWVKHPILGWATMASKALFNAGNIGHLAEDVSVHEHEGVPLTVHKFSPDHITLGQVWNPNVRRRAVIDPLQVHQIGVMDYLTNNLDRHQGNIMLRQEANDDGYHSLLAIDHERNFQYDKRLSNHWKFKHQGHVKESPLSYIDNQAMSDLNKSAQGWYSHENLVDWWGQHGNKIKDELHSQVENIKDENLRKHVRDNFMTRWHRMNNWATNLKDNPHSDEMYDAKHLHTGFDDVWNSKMQHPAVSSSFIKQLPKNPKDALMAITHLVNSKPKLTQRQTNILHNGIHHILSKITPEEAGDILTSVVHNPHATTKAIKNNPFVDVRRQMLDHFYDNTHSSPSKYKEAHMHEMVKAIDNLPEDKKEILKYWADRYRNILSDEQERRIA